MKFRLFNKKQDLVFLAVVAFLLCVGYVAVGSPVFFSQKTPASDVFRTDAGLLKKHVETLSSFSPSRSFPNATLDDAASYIEKELAAYCTNISRQEYEVSGKKVWNIVCVLAPDKEERLVIGAHYDSFGNTPGADDNASGVAGLLELARMLSKNEKALLFRTELVAFTLEEPPFFRSADMGSYRYAEKLHNDGEKVKLMIALETIGYFSDERGSQSFPHWIFRAIYPETGNYAFIVGRFSDFFTTYAFKRDFIPGSKIDVHSLNSPQNLFGTDFSDHRSFWAFDYPALMVTDTAFYRNGNYHEITDTPDALDYEKMAQTIDGVYSAILQMNGRE